MKNSQNELIKINENRLITITAAEQASKRDPELCGHGVVEKRIDCAVGVDGETTA